ncbi:MAG: hypothetical protein AAGI44_16820 [Pseudomonadota bacterium]
MTIFISAGEAFASTTISGKDFYGTWSTASSVLYPKRQILELAPDGGRWVQKDDQGKDRIYVLKESDISIDNDLLIIDYRSPDEGFRLKLVLGGWGIDDDKNIFGTVYMYQDLGKGLTLFNGIPMSFTSGIEQIPPQTLWSFFSETGSKRVEPGYIKELEDRLRKIESISISESPNTTEYSLEEIGYFVSVSKAGNSAHPSAIGVRLAPGNPAAMETVAKFEGDREEFRKYYSAYLEELEDHQREAQEYIEDLVRKMEAGNSAK